MNTADVKACFLSMALALLSACSQSADDPREALMDEIDRTLVLPVGSYPLHEYARYYAQRPYGKIAIFLRVNIDQGPRPSDFGCSEMLADGNLKDVGCDPLAEPKAGERHWVNIDYLPSALDGGCSNIEAVYDPLTEHILNLRCDGRG